MQAMILAAGMGKRLKHLTQDRTKCMIEVNGVSLIRRLLGILDQENLTRIIIVDGYMGANLKEYVLSLDVATPVVFVDNPVYSTTNNIYSLALARDCLVQDDTLLFESDLIFDKSIVDRLINDPRPSLSVVDKFESWMDGTCLKLDSNDRIVDFIPGRYLDFKQTTNYYKTVNIYKFSKEFSARTYVPFLTAYEQAMGENEYYESVIKLIAMLDNVEIRAMRLAGEVWYEIDDAKDLQTAEYLFTEEAQNKYSTLSSRYGGFWRFPKLKDFCYLVNPYFPSPRFSAELESNFDTLLKEYPSGMKVNSLLASELCDVCEEHIIAGNGAAELIKALTESCISGSVGIIRPTFEEYPNRLGKDRLITFTPSAEDFSYSARELIDFFSTHRPDNIVLINPDNPSGSYIAHDDLLMLAGWCRDNGITLVVDESFADFAGTGKEPDGPFSLLSDLYLNEYPNLIVIKSISKSYGVPGLRLGLLASSDVRLIEALKSDVSIWNINSFAEFFMQMFGKYKSDYSASLRKLSEARTAFTEQLRQINYLRVFDSSANYIMCELTGGHRSSELCAGLLADNNILIKDLSSKTGNGKQYIRIAVRTQEENTQLARILAERE